VDANGHECRKFRRAEFHEAQTCFSLTFFYPNRLAVAKSRHGTEENVACGNAKVD
jgi:hypothetical protein